MTCCKCHRLRWDTPAESVWEDQYGREYCIFHAPKEHKDVDEDEFNELIFKRIEEKSTKQRSLCFLSGIIFPWSITFFDTALGKNKPILDFRQAIFEKNISFFDFTAQQRFNFGHTTCKGATIFNNVKFNDSTYFENMKCFGSATFNKCSFSDNVNFSKATFEDKTNFELVRFRKSTDFTNTAFKGGLIVKRTLFDEVVNFENTTIDNITMLKKVNFDGGANFKYAIFLGISTFSECSFNFASDFSYSLFIGDTLFASCKTKNTTLTFEEIGVTSNITFNRLDLKKANFRFSPLDKIKFYNVTWKLSSDKKRFESSAESKLTGNMEYGEANIDREVLQDTISFYRQMKKKAKDNCDDEEASLWHYSEKELRLHSLRQNDSLLFQRTILETYRTISRYGEDPRQAAEVLFYLSLLLLATLALGGLYALGEPPFDITAPRVAKGLRAFAQYALFMKPDWSPPALFDFIAILLSRLLIPIQAAIFAFALRNKLHR